MGKISLPQPEAPRPESKPVAEPKTFIDNAVLKVRQEVLGEAPPDDITDKALEMIRVKSELGIDAANTDHDDKIKFIMHYAKELGYDDREKFRVFIRKLKTKLGLTDLSPNPIQKIYHWLKLEAAIQNLIKAQDGIKQRNEPSGSEA